jgi:hypothetical protein
MKELSRGAREALEQGLAFDGPSDEQRARVKQRMLVALGGGAVALGSAATAAGAGSAAAAAGSATAAVGSATAAVGVVAGATSAKGLLAGSLWVWFGIGIAAGVGVSGAAAVVSTSSPSPIVERSTAVSTEGDARTPSGDRPALMGSIPEPASPVATAHEPVSTPSARPSTEATSDAVPASDPSAAIAPSTLHDEAALLQAAQRALAAQQPDQALAALGDHERRFPAGVLGEERQAAKILAYCAVGRVDEARALVRTFAHSSPRSVLIPRLTDSCAGDALKR